MEKIKLSDMIVYYRKKCLQNDEFFKYYFEETDVQLKLERLELMYEVLGDVSMPLDYFKVFLYAGHDDGERFKFTKHMIKHIYKIIKQYDDIPIYIIDNLFSYYNKECFDKYQVKEYFDILVSKYKFTKQTLERFIQYIENSREKLKDFYLKECDKLAFIREQYPCEFIKDLKEVITTKYIEFDELLDILPSNSFFKKTSEIDCEYWAKYNDYRFILELLRGTINLDDYADGDYMVPFKQICQRPQGIVVENMYTSFTKREYLDSIKKEKAIIKSKIR